VYETDAIPITEEQHHAMASTAQEHPFYTIWRRPYTIEPRSVNSNTQQRWIYTT